jgi:type VI secretion system protein ImpA
MAVLESSTFAPDLAGLLAPVPGALDTGPSLRYDPLFSVIRQAREEDDTTVPRGEWERTLKKADWKLAAATCLQLLDGKTKDFQLAAWLCEAWIHLHQIAGLNAGIALLHGFAERYWDTVHPQIDDGDEDARVAPFVWLNENLPLVLNLHVPLLQVPDRKQARVTLADWDKTLLVDAPTAEQSRKAVPGEEKPLTRDDVIAAAASANNLSVLIQTKQQLQQAIAGWTALADLLDSKLRTDPPSIARVGEMLRRIERVVSGLVDGRDLAVPQEPELPNLKPPVETPDPRPPEVQKPMTVPAHPPVAASVFPGAELAISGSINNREEAYRMLEAISAYLMKTEPHSPTPYLIKRAVTWGRMSLVDLMQEIVREEGDMTRYLSLLGIKESSE